MDPYQTERKLNPGMVTLYIPTGFDLEEVWSAWVGTIWEATTVRSDIHRVIEELRLEEWFCTVWMVETQLETKRRVIHRIDVEHEYAGCDEWVNLYYSHISDPDELPPALLG